MMAPTVPKAPEARLQGKIAEVADARTREGLQRIDARMRDAGNDATVRLHYVSFIIDLGRIADRTRVARLFRAETPEVI